MSRIIVLFSLLLLFSVSCTDEGEAPLPSSDTMEETGTDSGTDANVDTNADAIPDTIEDSNVDAIPDTIEDSNVDAIPDTIEDSNVDAIPDTIADTNTDTNEEMSVDVNGDAGVGTDTETDTITEPADAAGDGLPDSDTEESACSTTCGPASDPHLVASYSFDEGLGDLACDSSGNGHHATVYGTPAWGAGQCGGDITYDGMDDWVLAPGVLSGLSGTDVTLEAWFYASAYPWENGVPHILTGGAENNYRLSLASGGTDGRIMWRLEIGGIIESAIYPPTAFPADQWVHLAGTYDGSIMRLFVNSVEVANHVASGPADAASDLEIGGWDSASNAFFDGYIDEVQVWDHARFAIEICGDAGGTWVGSDETGSCAY